MKKIVLIAGLFLIAIGLVACGGSDEEKGFKVGLALTGPRTDGGFNENAYQGIERVRDELGAEIVFNENTQPADYEKILREYAKQGCNIVVGHGYQFTDASKVVASEFPDVDFVVTSTTIENGTNLGSVLLDNKAQGFLQGALAALMNDSKTLGVIGGQDIPPIKNMTVGFTAGSKYINSEIKVLDAFTGDFDDASKVKEQALSMIGQGADTICVSANNAGRGAFDAAKEKGLYAIASIYVDFDEYKDSVLALGEADMAKAIFQIVEVSKKGEFEGKNYIKGIKDGVVDLKYNPSLENKIPDAVKEELEKIKTGIADKTLDIDKYVN